MEVPKQQPLEPGETVDEAWVAGVPSLGGRTAKSGGRLVLTNRRLIFEPANVPAVPHDMFIVAAPGPEFRVMARLSDLEDAEAVAGSRALLRLRFRSGQTVEFLIEARRLTPLWTRKNTKARDAALDAIRRAIGRR